MQHAEATIDKILSILQRMHRFDIINQVKDDVSDLINRISQSTTANGILIFVIEAVETFSFNLA